MTLAAHAAPIALLKIRPNRYPPYSMRIMSD